MSHLLVLPPVSPRTSRPLSKPSLRLDGEELALHLAQCRQAGRMRLMASMWAERAHGWIAPRFVTSIALGTSALALLMAWR
jgi:hypothetical protein